MEAQGVEADLKGTHVQGAVRSARILVGGRLREQRGRAVAAGLRENLLGQLKHEVSRRFRRLVGQRWVSPLSLESGHLDVGQSRSHHVAHLVDRCGTERKANHYQKWCNRQ